jgi:hypothetical protein
MPTSHRLHFRDLSYMKPEKFQDYLTLGELARVVDRDISRIRKLEQDGTIPQAQRYKLGQLEIRLVEPEASRGNQEDRLQAQTGPTT